jgi:predicted RNase H-like nuclease
MSVIVPASRNLRSVVGIDAAWTVRQPSGVALALETGLGWVLSTVAPSYASYILFETGAGDEGARSSVHLADVDGLLAATERLTGRLPDVIAVDMPLARVPICARRASDNAVSRIYGSRHCSTHTPSVIRPGPISDQLTASFARHGFTLATRTTATPALIEVYPHPALVELMHEARRLPYKVGKARKYWPTHTPPERRRELLAIWTRIIAHLECEIGGVREHLVLPDIDAGGRAHKAFEDMLDAVVCAWVGICFLQGRAKAFGDETSAIWIPEAERR